MQKASDALLILSPEEREAAQAYIAKRLRSLDGDQAAQVQELIQCTKSQVHRLQADRERLRSGTTTAAQIMQKLTGAALSGLLNLVAECNRAAHAASAGGAGVGPAAGTAEGAAEQEADGDVDEELASFLFNGTPDEEEHAAAHIKERMDNLGLKELELFRDACRELLTWWESERGQSEGLHIEQFGDAQSANGRVAIRQKREELRQQILNPFKRFYQDVNARFQRSNRERGAAPGG
jgi:hypothetical protein